MMILWRQDDVSLDDLVARERKEGRQAKYDQHYADNIVRNKKTKEGYDSDDEYGEGGSAHTKYEERSSKKAGKNFEREQQKAVQETKRLNKDITVRLLSCLVLVTCYLRKSRLDTCDLRLATCDLRLA